MEWSPVLRPNLKNLQTSPTLKINEWVKEFRDAGKKVFHFGFGESPFPVHPDIREALKEHADQNAYLPSMGLGALREKALGYIPERLQMGDHPRHVVIGPGSKELIFDLQLAVEGDLLHPTPSWVSYIPQSYITKDRVIKLEVNQESGYKITGDGLEDAILDSRKAGFNPTKLILNYPNNPTGLTYDKDELEKIGEVCRRYRILVISDEIYGLVNFRGDHLSLASVYPEGTIVTTGLSKHLSLGGYRLGMAFIPREHKELINLMRAIASETYSSVSSPIQYAAMSAMENDESLENYIRTCTLLHEKVVKHLWKSIQSLGIDYPEPQGAFYLYPDFENYRQVLNRKYGINDSEDFARVLMEKMNIAALPGTGFGDHPVKLRLRLSSTDFSGKDLLETYNSGFNGSDEELIKKCCPRVYEGSQRLTDFFNKL